MSSTEDKLDTKPTQQTIKELLWSLTYKKQMSLYWILLIYSLVLNLKDTSQKAEKNSQDNISHIE